MDVPLGPRVQDVNFAVELFYNLFERCATLENINQNIQRENTSLRRYVRDLHGDVDAFEHENAQRHQEAICERAIRERLQEINGKFAGMIYNISQSINGEPKIKSMIVDPGSIRGFFGSASTAARGGDIVEVPFEEILNRLHEISDFINEARMEPPVAPQQGRQMVAAPYAVQMQGNVPVFNAGCYNNMYHNHSRRYSRFPLLQPVAMPQGQPLLQQMPSAFQPNPSAGYFNGYGYYDGRGMWNGMQANNNNNGSFSVANGGAGYGSLSGLQMQAGQQHLNQHQPVQPPPAHINYPNLPNNVIRGPGGHGFAPCIMYFGVYGEPALVPPTPPPEIENQHDIVDQLQEAVVDAVGEQVEDAVDNDEMQYDGQENEEAGDF